MFLIIRECTINFRHVERMHLAGDSVTFYFVSGKVFGFDDLLIQEIDAINVVVFEALEATSRR
jgi:hypothetical protein